MRPGGGKAKGSQFERDICVKLSLWVSAGKRKDLFWRSAMSGGRATVSRGEVRQAGDITSVAAEGHILTDYCYIECKFVKDLGLTSFILDNKGALATYWKVALREAKSYKREPILIAKQNLLPPLVIAQKFGIFWNEDIDGIYTDMGVRVVIYKLDDILKLKFKSLKGLH
jgi:hypothetical protein